MPRSTLFSPPEGSSHNLQEENSMAELNTKPGTRDVSDFLKTVKDEQRRKDCPTIEQMMRKSTGSELVMWGSSISRRYRSLSRCQ
jgi:hypothetical protein